MYTISVLQEHHTVGIARYCCFDHIATVYRKTRGREREILRRRLSAELSGDFVTFHTMINPILRAHLSA